MADILLSKDNPSPNLFQRIGLWFKRFIATFKDPAQGEKTQGSLQEENPVVKQLTSNLDNELIHYNTSLLLPEIERDFQLSIKFMTDSGIADGREGIRAARNKEMIIIAGSRATRLFKLAKALLSGMSTKSQTELEAKRELMERNKQQDKHQHQYLEFLQYYRRHHLRSFNFFWGVLCLLIGTLLLIADFPLSLKLFEFGFDFKLRESWPPAIGISLCTIFIKIYYDNHIDLKYGHALITDSKFAEMFSSTQNEKVIPSKDEYGLKNLEEQKRKKFWHIGILSFTIIVIIILGIFRAEAMKALKINGISYGLNLLTFISLTLIFPIISGVCLSIGFSIWQNRARYRETNRKCKKTEEKYIDSLKEFTTIQKEHADIESEMEKWEDESLLNNYTEILLSYYDNGYKLGAFDMAIATEDKDIFLLANRWRNKALVRKMNNSIIKIDG